MGTAHRRRFYLVGVAGNPNYGDDLIVARWLAYLAGRFPHADVWLDTPHPGPASALFSGAHPHLTVTDTLFRLRDLADEPTFEQVSYTIRRSLAEPGYTPWWVAGIDALKGAEVVHLVGGGFANEMWPDNLGVVAALGWVAEHWAARVVATGVGITPLSESNADLLAEAVQRFQVFDVRDAHSLEAMAPLARLGGNLLRSADDVLLEDPRTSLDPNTARSFDLGLVIQGDLLELPLPALIAYVESRVRDWGVAEDRIVFVECIPRVDAMAFEAISARWPAARLISFQQIWQQGFPAGPHQRWISTRFHPHLIAASAGAAGIAISVKSDYYDAKHQSLLDLGSGWAHTGLDLDVEEATGPGPLVHSLTELGKGKLALAGRIYRSELGVVTIARARRGLGRVRRWPSRLRGHPATLGSL